MRLRWLVRSKEVHIERTSMDGDVIMSSRKTETDAPILQVWLPNEGYWEDVEVVEEHERLEY